MEHGIQVTNNKNKALLNSDIVINFDIDEEKIKKYNFKQDATIINIKNEIRTIDSEFKGKILNNYKISYNEDILSEIKDKLDFDSNILYESLIYRKDTFSNIRRQFEIDEVKLIELYK